MHHPDSAAALGQLSAFRRDFYSCLSRRADALFELTDAVLCCDGPVRTLVEASLAAEHRRGHGSLYGALAHGQVEIARLRRALATVALPRAAAGAGRGHYQLAASGSPHLTGPGAVPYLRRGKGTHIIMVPGWPYSLVCALETGRHSWTAPLDAQRLAPGDDAAAVTAAQLRWIVTDLIATGQWRPGDPDILIVADAGYDSPRLAFLLEDLPLAVLVWMRSDRVLRRPAPPHAPGRE